jgi:hypothetical protein
MSHLTPADRLARLAAGLDDDGHVSTEFAPGTGGAGGAHPGLAEHAALGLAADTALATHAATAHGLASHAIDGAFHSGSEVLPTQGQKNALAGTQGTPGSLNPFVTTQDTRLSDARAPTAHTHPYEASGAVAAHAAASDPHTGYATDADLAAHAATPHGGGGAWTSVLKLADESHNLSAVVTDDATLRFTTLPNTSYSIRLLAFFLTNATADLKYRLVHLGTTTRVRRLVRRTATADNVQTLEFKVAFDTADVILSTTGVNPWLEEDIILQVGAAGGLLKLQWGQVTSGAGPTTCLEGSSLEYAVT